MLDILLEIGENGKKLEDRYRELENQFQNFYFYIYEIRLNLVLKKESKDFLVKLQRNRLSDIDDAIIEL